jgi:hypothetical protein
VIQPAKSPLEVGVPEKECRELVQRILASKEFQRTSRLRDFLLYVVDRKLAGARHEVTEVLIGQRVFGRAAGYNPGDDSIVRTEARSLRQRLQRYFEGEGSGEPIIIEVPRGGYLPVFLPRRVVESTVEAVLPAPSKPRGWRWVFTAMAVVGLFASVWLARSRPNSPMTGAIVESPAATVQLDSSNIQLVGSFESAKHLAMGYVYSGDPVGSWYDSTAGNRYAFCMRDASHQRGGAAVLGLTGHTRNMLRRFASSISRTRDWCGFWEINKDGFPAPADYTDDTDFWYCLPANFDLMRACYREFLWTGDSTYFDSVFSNFYDRSVSSYVDAWDRDRDGIMESGPELGRRGMASYYQEDPRPLTGADLVAAQYHGYLIYAAIQERKGVAGSLSQRLAREYRAKAHALRTRFNTEWWNAIQNRFYSSVLPDRRFNTSYIADSNVYSLMFGIVEDGAKTEAALDSMERIRPQFDQLLSYYPEVLYEYGRNEPAYRFLQELTDPNFRSRGLPEVAFAVVGAIASGMMGLSPDAPRSTVETLSRLPQAIDWVRVSRVPMLRNEIGVRHQGITETSLTNEAGPEFQWKASFAASAGNPGAILIDGMRVQTSLEQRINQQSVIFAIVPVKPSQTRTARYLKPGI